MSLESKTFNWPENKQPEKKEVFDNIEKVKNTYLIKNVQFMDQHKRMQEFEKVYKKDEENEAKKNAYLKEKKEYERLRDEISHLELMDDNPIPDKYLGFRTRENFLDELLKERGFTKEELDKLFKVPKETKSQSLSSRGETRADARANLKFAQDTARPLESAYWQEKSAAKDGLSMEEMRKELKFAQDTARPLDTAYWQEKIKKAKKKK